MKPIINIARKFKIKKNDLFMYGDHIAKINPILKTPISKKKLILVTATSPTPAGEGKTTTTIGLNDAMNKIGKKSMAALREPSMGPVFGVKGGANGGGKAQIIPKDEINFHFTGDMHAITAANNLISACIDNNIYWGNSLNINPDKIVWRRVLDVNDRSLRKIEVNIGGKNNIKYTSGFDITVASEIMAIFCLATNELDLKNRISNIIVAYTKDEKPIYVKDLQIVGAILKILKDAIKPNLVQSLEGNLAIVHGGPFANIAHGCNSIIATKTALNLSDYVITEAGFASDLGAEKFLDIVCNVGSFNPNAIVLVTSTRSLKMHGGVDKDNLKTENIDAIKKGIENLEAHIKNIKNFNIPFVVSITQLDISLKSEVQTVCDWLKKNKYEYALNSSYENGGSGAIDLAKKVVLLCNKKSKLKPIYDISLTLDKKIENICKKCYGAIGVEYSKEALIKLKKLKNTKSYVCMAKTPASLTDDEKILVIEKPFKINVKDIIVANGANFIIVLTGNIFRMPGLPKIPEANKM
ncbi:MAG: formate--tetrahydrofolate ligase [Mycoplasmoidaceae bacterium]|nr:MAG: formate--tetrahydrofolate ligase [Mycoplasmoidaceae bacterium]